MAKVAAWIPANPCIHAKFASRSKSHFREKPTRKVWAWVLLFSDSVELIFLFPAIVTCVLYCISGLALRPSKHGFGFPGIVTGLVMLPFSIIPWCTEPHGSEIEGIISALFVMIGRTFIGFAIFSILLGLVVMICERRRPDTPTAF